MIMNFLKKVPAGMMIVPLLIGAVLNTFFPQALQLGSLTTATFSNAGAATAMGIQLVCLGTTLQLGDIGRVLKRGGILLLSKFCIGSVIGIAVGKIFGPAGVLGLSALAIISAVTNSNGSVYLALMQTYGDDVDGGAMALLALNDGPFMTMIAMGVSGLANIPIQALIATVLPILVGIILGNMDKKFAEFVSPAGSVMIPFVGLTLGAGINLMNVLKGGIPGVILGLISVFVGGAFIVFCDRMIGRRPGYAGWAVATTAGNAVAVPILAHEVISGIQHGLHAVIRYQGLSLQHIISLKLSLMLMYPNGCARLKHDPGEGPSRTVSLLLCHEGVEGHISHPLLHLVLGNGLHLVFSSNHASCPPVIPYGYPSLYHPVPGPSTSGTTLYRYVLHCFANMLYSCRHE